MSKKSGHQISYSGFDIFYYKGKKITHLPLLERKEVLEEVIPEDSALLYKVQWIEGNAEQYFDLIKQHEKEGIVLKKAESKYQINKRSYDWLKIINYQFAYVNIFGLKKDEFGLLLNFENGEYAGLLEFMPPNNRKEFYRPYRDFIVEKNDKFVYLDPKLKMKMKYRNLTKKGLLGIPSFVEWAN